MLLQSKGAIQIICDTFLFILDLPLHVSFGGTDTDHLPPLVWREFFYFPKYKY